MTKKLNIYFFVVLFWLFCALLGILNPFHENQIVLNKILQEPSWNNWCGYDHLGRSICERIILGAKTSFSVAIIVVLISFIVGTTLGVIGAWFGGIYDKVLVILIDIFIAFPGTIIFMATGYFKVNIPDYSIGYVNIIIVLLVSLTSIFTANIGAKAASKINKLILRRIFAIFLLFTCVSLIIEHFIF